MPRSTGVAYSVVFAPSRLLLAASGLGEDTTVEIIAEPVMALDASDGRNAMGSAISRVSMGRPMVGWKLVRDSFEFALAAQHFVMRYIVRVSKKPGHSTPRCA